MRLELMSKNIVNIMSELSKNEGLARLLVNDTSNPFDPNLPTIDKSKLILPNSEESKIHPFPFDPEAQLADSSFLRVYYNQGTFSDNEVIAESELHIDIIVAKSLWLINDGERSQIRPYEIMSRITDMIGSRSTNSTIKLQFIGWQHLAVNSKFDAIRLYCNYFSVET